MAESHSIGIKPKRGSKPSRKCQECNRVGGVRRSREGFPYLCRSCHKLKIQERREALDRSRKALKDRKCKHCGKVMNSLDRRQVVCSVKCRGPSTKVACLCSECGSEFFRNPGRLKRYGRCFCSRSCQGRGLLKTYRRHTVRLPILYLCGLCAKPRQKPGNCQLCRCETCRWIAIFRGMCKARSPRTTEQLWRDKFTGMVRTHKYRASSTRTSKKPKGEIHANQVGIIWKQKFDSWSREPKIRTERQEWIYKLNNKIRSHAQRQKRMSLQQSSNRFECGKTGDAITVGSS